MDIRLNIRSHQPVRWQSISYKDIVEFALFTFKLCAPVALNAKNIFDFGMNVLFEYSKCLIRHGKYVANSQVKIEIHRILVHDEITRGSLQDYELRIQHQRRWNYPLWKKGELKSVRELRETLQPLQVHWVVLSAKWLTGRTIQWIDKKERKNAKTPLVICTVSSWLISKFPHPGWLQNLLFPEILQAKISLKGALIWASCRRVYI
jgi:hypothetical protein